jgi:hypothetical protein
VLNEFASVMRRLVRGLLQARGNTYVASSVVKAFADKAALATAQKYLLNRAASPGSTKSPFGEDSIGRYLGDGLLEGGSNAALLPSMKHAFVDKHAIDAAKGKLRKRQLDP